MMLELTRTAHISHIWLCFQNNQGFDAKSKEGKGKNIERSNKFCKERQLYCIHLQNEPRHEKTGFLAHLSRWLIGEPIVYPWSCVRRPSIRRPFTMLKHLLLRNRWADQSQILCGASFGRGNHILFAASGSHDQDGRHAHIWSKPFKNLLQNRWADFHETWYVASGTPAHHSLFK